jgi:hypothetical protein
MPGMSKQPKPKTEAPVHPDWELVLALGGVVKVSNLLGYEYERGPQRVHNWKHRGIPPAVKLAHPKLFLRKNDPARRVLMRAA